MLSEIFYWLFNMSISATLTGVIILLIGKIRKIPRRIMTILFAIPFFRMWVPIGMGSKYSLMSLISKITSKTITVFKGPAVFTTTNFAMAADSYFPIAFKTASLKMIFQIASFIWFTIAIAFLIALFIIYATTKSELKGAAHLKDNIYLTDKITSPAVYGIIHEKIMLPKRYDIGDLKFVLMHENAHIRRKDNLWRILAIVTACIHWFNPLAWLFLKSFLTNLELACDELVLKKCSEAEKKNYAIALLNYSENKSLYVSAFGGAKLRVRIERIVSYKKLSALSITAFIILAIAVGYVLLTNAM